MARCTLFSLLFAVLLATSAASRLPIALRGHTDLTPLAFTATDTTTHELLSASSKQLLAKKKSTSRSSPLKSGGDDNLFGSARSTALTGFLEKKVSRSAAKGYGKSLSLQRKYKKSEAKYYSGLPVEKKISKSGARYTGGSAYTGTTYTPYEYDYSNFGVAAISDMMRTQHETTMSIINNIG